MTTNDQMLEGFAIDKRAQSLFVANQQQTYVQTDRLFAVLLLLQWVAGIIAALVISPRTWAGVISETHIHVLAAVFLGGIIAGLPIAMALLVPGRPITRHVIAVGQMLASGLLIHLSGGRIETHFHIFGSLAFLAFYRDWRVLITATVVVAVDHFWRGIAWPYSVFGADYGTWRAIGIACEHAAWVVFEDIFLLRAIHLSVNEMREVAQRRARLEITNDAIVKAVGDIRATTDAVATNSRELSATASQLTSDSSKQSSSVTQTAMSVKRIAEVITDSASNAQQTDKIAQLCASKAGQGGQAVEDTIAAMKQIAERISSVESIAQSTDLLALNAEVQAARVGEQGRGFAVVAMEIRKLAEVSRSTAQEISELTNQSVAVAVRAGELLGEIVPGVQQTATLVQSIAQSAVEQDQSLGEMKSAMSDLDETSRRNAETSDLLSTTAQDMNQHAERLQDSMTMLNVDGAT